MVRCACARYAKGVVVEAVPLEGRAADISFDVGKANSREMKPTSSFKEIVFVGVATGKR